MAEWNIFWEKEKSEVEKTEDGNSQYSIQNSHILQTLITKTSIFSYHENVILIVMYKIFPKM